jgi:hypothetical protein
MTVVYFAVQSKQITIIRTILTFVFLSCKQTQKKTQLIHVCTVLPRLEPLYKYSFSPNLALMAIKIIRDIFCFVFLNTTNVECHFLRFYRYNDLQVGHPYIPESTKFKNRQGDVVQNAFRASGPFNRSSLYSLKTLRKKYCSYQDSWLIFCVCIFLYRCLCL